MGLDVNEIRKALRKAGFSCRDADRAMDIIFGVMARYSEDEACRVLDRYS